MGEVEAGVALPGLYPMNEATKARYEAWKQGGEQPWAGAARGPRRAHSPRRLDLAAAAKRSAAGSAAALRARPASGSSAACEAEHRLIRIRRQALARVGPAREQELDHLAAGVRGRRGSSAPARGRAAASSTGCLAGAARGWPVRARDAATSRAPPSGSCAAPRRSPVAACPGRRRARRGRCGRRLRDRRRARWRAHRGAGHRAG